MSQKSNNLDIQDAYVARPVAVGRDRQGVVTGRRRVPVYVWFLLPGLLLYIMFFIGPMFAAFRLSFYGWPGIGTTMHFVGLRNFANAFTDPEVTTALWHN